MSAQALQENDLLELLLQLKKTTPDQARAILNAQPQIASALLAVMVNLGAVNMEVVQKTLAGYGALPGAQSVQPVAPMVPSIAQIPAIPPHMAHAPPMRGGTPTYTPPHQPTPPYSQPLYASQPPGLPSYGAPPPHVPGYGAPPPAVPTPPPALPPALAHIPEDQKALVYRVISMSRDEIYQLPPEQRGNIIQLRATLGMPV